MTADIQLPIGVTFLERGWLSSNNVLLHDTEQAVLIDTGYWTHAKQTAALIQSVLGSKSLDVIVNTHLHSDHCGGNAHLQAVYPKVQTRIPPGHFAYVDQWNAEALTYTPTGQHCPQFTAHSSINSGDVLQVAGRQWIAYSAPGHDPHSIILFCHEEGVLISADALWERGFGVVFPEIEGISAFEEVAATLDLIEMLAPRLVLPGHGSAFTDVKNALAYARSRLTGFSTDPLKHARYASKVLMKFKLLELRSVEMAAFCEWANNCSYFHQLHKHFDETTFENWTLLICDSLVKSGAATRIGNRLIDR
jgi:glyoxylase-like metal-dependent hydrolase (beta-lactamase superfamily II)